MSGPDQPGEATPSRHAAGREAAPDEIVAEAPCEPPADDPSRADIGVVVALPIEIAAFLRRCERVRKYVGSSFTFRGGKYDGIRVAVVEGGTGFARARRATQALVDAHAPDWVLCCGFSGALVPSIKAGDIVIADSIADTHGQSLSIDVHVPADHQAGIHVGRLLTSDNIVRLAAEKTDLGERHQALAVDMESLAVAQVCRESKVRFLAIRVISDDLTTDLPAEVLSLVAPTGSARLGAALGAIWKRPQSVREMWELRRAASAAAERLATFLDGVIVQLYNAGRQQRAAGATPPSPLEP
jgi:adenosylhomocysteine nucleosidase